MARSKDSNFHFNFQSQKDAESWVVAHKTQLKKTFEAVKFDVLSDDVRLATLNSILHRLRCAYKLLFPGWTSDLDAPKIVIVKSQINNVLVQHNFFIGYFES